MRYIDPNLLRGSIQNQPDVFTSGYALGWQVYSGMIYFFANTGDQVPLHSHTEGLQHTIGLMYGTIKYTTINSDGSNTDMILVAPSILKVPANIEHSITAMSSPVDTSGPLVTNLDTLAAVCINLRMAQLDPALIAKNLSAVTPIIDDLITKLTAAKAQTV